MVSHLTDKSCMTHAVECLAKGECNHGDVHVLRSHKKLGDYVRDVVDQ